MTYRVEITNRARRDISAFARYCRSYSPAFWQEQARRLALVFETWLPESPHMWSFFFATGEPYRAYLFEVGDRTKYWIVCSVNDETRTINVVRMWNAARNPSQFLP